MPFSQLIITIYNFVTGNVHVLLSLVCIALSNSFMSSNSVTVVYASIGRAECKIKLSSLSFTYPTCRCSQIKLTNISGDILRRILYWPSRMQDMSNIISLACERLHNGQN